MAEATDRAAGGSVIAGMAALGRFLARFALAAAATLAVAGPASPQSVAAQSPIAESGSRPTLAALERMVGRMLIVGFHGENPSNETIRDLGRQIADGHTGGVIFLRRNIGSQEEVKALTAFFRLMAAKSPILIAVDQEGGDVQRLGRDVGFPETPAAIEIARGDPEDAERAYFRMASELRSWGFNLNFGPVLDVNVNASNPIIARYGRNYSDDPATVAAFGEAFVRAHRDAGVVTAVKHFPGHGSSTTDSHRGPVDISATWKSYEVEPFKMLADSGLVDMVMVGHLLLGRGADAKGMRQPASLSPLVVSQWLRPMLGADVIVVADDLDMAAIRDDFSVMEAAERAIRAGNDLLIHANTFAADARLATKIAHHIASIAMNDPDLRQLIAKANARLAGASFPF